MISTLGGIYYSVDTVYFLKLIFWSIVIGCLIEVIERYGKKNT